MSDDQLERLLLRIALPPVRLGLYVRRLKASRADQPPHASPARRCGERRRSGDAWRGRGGGTNDDWDHDALGVRSDRAGTYRHRFWFGNLRATTHDDTTSHVAIRAAGSHTGAGSAIANDPQIPSSIWS